MLLEVSFIFLEGRGGGRERRRSLATGMKQSRAQEGVRGGFGDAGAETLLDGSKEEDYTDLDDDRCWVLFAVTIFFHSILRTWFYWNG